MDREQSWQVIAEQRLGFGHLLSKGCPTPIGNGPPCAKVGGSATWLRT